MSVCGDLTRGVSERVCGTVCVSASLSSLVSLIYCGACVLLLHVRILWGVCVCVCICVCVRPIAYACRKMTVGVCVYFLCMCVLWDQVCELAMAVPSVDGSARDLV